MTLLTLDDLDWIRSEYANAMPSTCTVRKWSTVAGKPAQLTDTTYVNIPCRVDAARRLSGDIQLNGALAREPVLGEWIVALPYDTVLSPSWVIVISANDPDPVLAGRVFTIKGFVDENEQVEKLVLCTEGQ